jgi:hypothetical protein
MMMTTTITVREVVASAGCPTNSPLDKRRIIVDMELPTDPSWTGMVRPEWISIELVVECGRHRRTAVM